MRPRWGKLRLAAVLLGMTIPASGLVAHSRAAEKDAAARGPKVIYYSGQAFRIPVNIAAADRNRIKDVLLCVSTDTGYTWKVVSQMSPDRPAFTFNAPRDAEYWFATRVVDQEGRPFPPDDRQVEPGMKVIVDTTPPSVVFASKNRRGSVVSVRWEVKDENLDLGSLLLEYKAEGVREWRKVPIARPALIGGQSWDAGTAEPLNVRLSVSDKARNVQTEQLTLPYGGATPPAGDTGQEFAQAPPFVRMAGSTADAPADPGGQEEGFTGEAASPFAGLDDQPPAAAAPEPAPAPTRAPEPPAQSPASGLPQGAPATAGNGRTMLVASPRFNMAYAVDDAGPNGPASVELWITNDGGRTWSRRPEDPDRVSPYPVDLGGEGTFGLFLVARSANGLGDQPPAPGDPPQLWVEVDSTPPAVQLDPPVIGTGGSAGKLSISWRVSDLHLAPRPVVLSYRPDGSNAPWQPIAGPQENTGRYIWTMPPNIPPRFHIRIDVKDSVGNTGSAETTEMGPILVDRARPRSRIIGLDPSAHGGPSARPLH